MHYLESDVFSKLNIRTYALCGDSWSCVTYCNSHKLSKRMQKELPGVHFISSEPHQLSPCMDAFCHHFGPTFRWIAMKFGTNLSTV